MTLKHAVKYRHSNDHQLVLIAVANWSDTEVLNLIDSQWEVYNNSSWKEQRETNMHEKLESYKRQADYCL